jgi:hypothetical protein
LKGKNMGNQENMSGETRWAVSGWMDRPMFEYRWASKYPARPCKGAACGMWKVTVEERVLCELVSGTPGVSAAGRHHDGVDIAVVRRECPGVEKRRLTSRIKDEVPPRMLKLPTLLDPLATSPSDSTAIRRDDIDRRHHDHIRRLRTTRRSRARSRLGIELRRRDRRQVSGIRDGY